MLDEVWPQRGSRSMYAEETPDGFSCRGCHMVESE
jgi:hypothetical protein